MGTSDRFGGLCERWIARAGILKPVFRHRDGVGAATPFADQPGARLQTEAWIGSDLASGPEHLRQRLQLATCGLAEPTVLEFLEPVPDPPDQQVAADPWRLAVIKPPPFAAQVIDTGTVRGRQLRWFCTPLSALSL